MKIVAVTLLAALALTGCSALREGPFQSLEVTTTPASAKCDLSYVDGPVFSTVLSDATVYNLRRSHRNVTVTCSKPGYAVKQTTISPYGDPKSVSYFPLNPLGDVFTNTMHRYPAAVHLDLQKI